MGMVSSPLVKKLRNLSELIDAANKRMEEIEKLSNVWAKLNALLLKCDGSHLEAIKFKVILSINEVKGIRNINDLKKYYETISNLDTSREEL